MSARTFKVGREHVSGEDVEAWQRELNALFREWGANRNRLRVDGDYGLSTRSATSDALRGLGIEQDALAKGVTPWLRTKVRDRRLSLVERARFAKRGSVRRRIVREINGDAVSAPFAKVLADSWGFHLGVHDGLDLITPERAILHSMTPGEVIRADAAGWWGLGAPANAALRAKGDGIIVVRCGTDAGPFERGLHICYGHAEHARVRVGSRVYAGQPIGEAGLANAWHIHLMVNGGTWRDGRALGVGNRDPRPFYEYARKEGR